MIRLGINPELVAEYEQLSRKIRDAFLDAKPLEIQEELGINSAIAIKHDPSRELSLKLLHGRNNFRSYFYDKPYQNKFIPSKNELMQLFAATALFEKKSFHKIYKSLKPKDQALLLYQREIFFLDDHNHEYQIRSASNRALHRLGKAIEYGFSLASPQGDQLNDSIKDSLEFFLSHAAPSHSSKFLETVYDSGSNTDALLVAEMAYKKNLATDSAKKLFHKAVLAGVNPCRELPVHSQMYTDIFDEKILKELAANIDKTEDMTLRAAFIKSYAELQINHHEQLLESHDETRNKQIFCELLLRFNRNPGLKAKVIDQVISDYFGW